MRKIDSKRATIIGRNCVACGSCEGACPKAAIRVFRGVCAAVDSDKCVGCGKCAKVCPAGLISITKECER